MFDKIKKLTIEILISLNSAITPTAILAMIFVWPVLIALE